jgi:Uma2 family endonuclease
MSERSRLITADELARYPDDDFRYELVDGRIVRMSPVGFPHARTVTRLLVRLGRHVEMHALGVVVTELGFKLGSNPDTVRAPDVAFITCGRIPPAPRGFWNGSPDLAIEVLSPEDRPTEIQSKIDEYLACGVRSVVIVDPDRELATVFRPRAQPVVVRAEETLDLGDVIDGFSCPLRELFS